MSHETFKTCRHEQFDPNESEILVSFKYQAGRPMTMYRNNGDPGDPAEPDEIEILKIETCLGMGSDITDLISEAEYEYIETYLYESWVSDQGYDEADIKYQEWKDREKDDD